MKKIITIFCFSLLTIFVYANGQKEKVYEYYYVKDIIINIGINYNNNMQPEILLHTKDGCSNTGFKIKQGFYDAGQKMDGIIITQNMNELNNYRENYFELDYLDIFSEEYFEQYYLVFILQSYGTGDSYRNERIEILDKKYAFVNELWHADFPWAKACLDIGLFIIKIPK